MKNKTGIAFAAIGIPHQYGREKALGLGFTEREFKLLATLAWLPKFVNGFWNDATRREFIETMARKPEDALSVIVFIRKEQERMHGSRAAKIRNILTDLDKGGEPNWMLPNKVIASLFCKKFNQTNMKGESFLKLVVSVKKERQRLAESFPIIKGTS